MSSIAGNSYSLPSINNREADRKRAEGRQGFLEVAMGTGRGRVGRGARRRGQEGGGGGCELGKWMEWGGWKVDRRDKKQRL